MKTVLISKLKIIGLLAFALSAPLTIRAQEVFSLAGYARPAPMQRYEPDLGFPTRRFSYTSTGETRLDKGVRTFRLALGGIPGSWANWSPFRNATLNQRHYFCLAQQHL